MLSLAARQTPYSQAQHQTRHPGEDHAWWPRFASVIWTLTGAEEGSGQSTEHFNSPSLAVHSDSLSSTPFSRKA